MLSSRFHGLHFQLVLVLRKGKRWLERSGQYSIIERRRTASLQALLSFIFSYIDVRCIYGYEKFNS